MIVATIFKALIIGHVLAGAAALVTFWVPVLSRKGGAAHRRWGRAFIRALCAAAILAIAMAIMNLTVSSDRHPTLADRDAFQGLFGWMMLYLGVLTLGLAQYGRAAARSGGTARVAATKLNLSVQALVALAAIICAFEGVRLGQPLMVVLAGLGLGSSVTFVVAMLRDPADRQSHIREHLKAMVGAGIAAYTAFLSVGLLQIMPEQVFNPLIWAIPSVIGVAVILTNLQRLNSSRRAA